MKLVFTVLMIAVIALGISSQGAFGYEDNESGTGYGNVVEVSKDSITLKEAVYDNGEKRDPLAEDTFRNVTYQVGPETAFENVDSLREITKGQPIEIQYLDSEGVKRAQYITLYKKYNDIDLPEEGPEEPEID